MSDTPPRTTECIGCRRCNSLHLHRASVRGTGHEKRPQSDLSSSCLYCSRAILESDDSSVSSETLIDGSTRWHWNAGKRRRLNPSPPPGTTITSTPTIVVVSCTEPQRTQEDHDSSSASAIPVWQPTGVSFGSSSIPSSMPRTSPGLDDEHLCSGLVIPTLSRDPPLATLREIVSVVIDLLIQHTETTYNAIQNDIQPTDSAGTPAIHSLTTNESYGTMTLPLIPSGPQHSPFKRSRLDSTARSSNCALRRRKLADIGRRPPAPWTTTQLKRLQEAAAVHHSKRLPLPQLSPAGNVISSTPTGISRLPRAAKRPAPVQHYPTLPGVDRIHHYLGQQPNHVLGLGPSGHPGAGLGIWALSPLPFGIRGTSWKDNILCQYGGRRLPLAFIEHQDYHTDYAIGWPRFNEGIDGQLDSADSIGHFINDDFSRDGGSLQPTGTPPRRKHTSAL